MEVLDRSRQSKRSNAKGQEEYELLKSLCKAEQRAVKIKVTEISYTNFNLE